MIFKDKEVLITGGTGSLGKQLVSRILSGKQGTPAKVIIFSRDETKQHEMRLEWKRKAVATDEIIYRQAEEILEFRIGDVRDFQSIEEALNNVDIVINAAALKQVPTCEYFPYEAVRTNVEGAHNIVTAIANNGYKVDTVICVSTDKACKPINVMGMTKAIQERVFIQGNMKCPETRFIGVRYGNVLASRGSVIPLFIDQIKRGGPVTITDSRMTRFLISLDEAVDTIFFAIKEAGRGETIVPKPPSALMEDVVNVMIGDRNIEKQFIGIRPGEKIHEILISEEECFRTINRGDYFAIQTVFPEFRYTVQKEDFLGKEFSSADNLMSNSDIKSLLEKNNLLV
ncbi:MAG: polysaccharide biosynthesis protein [Bacteroidetes bacterium]|nr:polysaccharide biosynthesis protein [Bacteroidota bacterium]